MQAGIRVFSAALVALSLSSCSEDNETKEDFCKLLGESRVNSRACRCYVRAVTRELGGKSEDFMLNAAGDLSREERDRVKRTMDSITGRQFERIGDNIEDCRADKEDGLL
jgi:NurA-like 5'-3' nuclease